MIKIPESVMIAENDEQQEGATAKIAAELSEKSRKSWEEK